MSQNELTLLLAVPYVQHGVGCSVLHPIFFTPLYEIGDLIKGAESMNLIQGTVSDNIKAKIDLVSSFCIFFSVL